MIKFKSRKDGYIFEAVEGSIHCQILKNDKDYEIVEDKPKKKKKVE